MTRVLFAIGLLSTIGAANLAEAQTSGTRHRLTVAGGIVWSGSYAVGDNTAELRQSALGANPPPFTLFRAESSLGSAVGLEGRIGVALSPSIAIEGAVSWSKPQIDVTIVDDVEGGNAAFEGETTSQYIVEASVVWTLPFVREDARLRPYVIGGGGYLRQLHEDNTLVETGQIYHVGGGAEYLLRGQDGRRRPLGVRGDVRAYIRKDGIEFEDKVRTYSAVSALMFFAF